MAAPRSALHFGLVLLSLNAFGAACSESSGAPAKPAVSGAPGEAGGAEGNVGGIGGAPSVGVIVAGSDDTAGQPGAGEAMVDALPVPAILPIPEHVKLSAVPAPAVHPRLFFSAEDLPELRKRAAEVPSAMAALKRLAKETAALRATPLYVALRDDAAVTAQQLQAQLVEDPSRMFLGTSQGGFYGQLAGGAYLSVVDDDSPLHAELCHVLAGAAQLQAKSYAPNLADATASDANLDLAFAYDVLYDCLTAVERNTVRALIAKMTAGRAPFGTKLAPQQQSTGDVVQYDSLVLASLAIEGEAGYDPKPFDDNLAKLANFTSRYGIHRAGYVHEDWGFFAQGMHQGALMLLAAARRGHDLFATGRVYQSLLQPFYEATPWMPGKLAGHGSGPSFDVGLAASALYPVLSYLYPEDPLVGFVMQQTHAADGDAHQEEAPLPEAMFGNAFDAQASAKDVATGLRLPTTFFDEDRGILNARSSFAPDATVLSFDCRMDTWDLQRVHADRNNFTLLAQGRSWIVDGSMAEVASGWHAGIRIDGVGPSDSPRMPGLLRSFGNGALFAAATGDASAAYAFDRASNSGKIDTGFVWRDFLYQPQAQPDEWRTHAIRAEAMHLPVLRAERTVALGRFPSPFVVVIDEIDRDATAHEYEWWAPVPATLLLEETTSGVLLRDSADAVATAPRLFVQVLSPAAATTPTLEVRKTALDTGGSAPATGLVTSAHVAAPRFVVVLTPIDAGDAPPEATWDDDALELTVSRAGSGQTIDFRRSKSGPLEVQGASRFQ